MRFIIKKMIIYTHLNDIHCIKTNFQISQIFHDTHSKLQIIFDLEHSKYIIICIDHIQYKYIIIQQNIDNIHNIQIHNFKSFSIKLKYFKIFPF